MSHHPSPYFRDHINEEVETTNSLQGIHQLNGLLSNTIRRKKKAFGDSISDWSQTKGLESTYIYPRDSNGVRVDENSTEAYSGYAKCKFQHFVWVLRKVLLLKDGLIIKTKCFWIKWVPKIGKQLQGGKLDGLWTGWYQNRQKKGEEHYKAGKQDGLSIAWQWAEKR